ncbi:MAG: hypothetical protein AAGI15_12940 [Pseudomonadota bacterium]
MRLDVGELAQVHFAVRFTVTEAWGVVYNTATTVSRECVPDDSTDGDDPDPNGDGIPDEQVPTPISWDIPAPPRLGVSKRASATRYLGEGTFSNDIELQLENFTDAVLTDVELIDDLTAVFGNDVRDFEIIAGSLRSSELKVNGAYDGRTDLGLLAPGNSLEPGPRATVSFTVNYRPLAEQGTFFNQAMGKCALCLTDLSTDGDDPDPNGDGAPDEQQPTPLPFELPARAGPLPGLAKSASSAETLEGNERRTEITLTLRNFGEAPLEDLSLTDDLAAAFASAESFEVEADSLRSPQLTINTTFDGATNRQLLAQGQRLAPGATATVNFAIRFEVTADTGALFNSATVTATDAPADESTNGTDPDPDGDGDPAEQAPTPIPYDPLAPPGTPIPGLAKALTSLETLMPGRYRLQFLFTLENFGDGVAEDVQLEDALDTTFPGPVTFEIERIASETLAVREDFDGRGQRLLLRGDDRLESGAQAQVELTLILDAEPGALFENSAELTAAGGRRDRSTDGTDPDPNGDGDPEESRLTEILIPVTVAPALSQRLQIDVLPQPRVTRIGRTVGYTLTVTNLLDQPQTAVTVADTAPPGFRPDASAVVLVRAGPDGVLGTGDDDRVALAASGSSTLSFAPFDLAPQEAVEIRFPSQVTTAARVGPARNKAIAASEISSEVSDDGVVDIIIDTLFSTATIIGKVFHDRDGNGLQASDGSEEGVAGARLITPDGLLIETDQHGRYHIADIEAPDRFGLNYVVKLDIASLPLDAVAVNDPRQIARLSPGGLAKLNFAVRWSDRTGSDPCCGDFEHLDYLGPWPAQKKLDVRLRAVTTPDHAAEADADAAAAVPGRTLLFDVHSNYADVAACLQVAVFQGDETEPVASARKRVQRSRDQIEVSLPKGSPGAVYRYALYAEPAAGEQRRAASCPDLTPGALGLGRALDATTERRFRLPQAAKVDDTDHRALSSSLARDQIPLPPVIPQRIARQRKDRFAVREQLTADTQRLRERLTHGWQARRPSETEIVAVTDRASIEVAGFDAPVQLGGERGAIQVERDNNDFEDDMRFTAQATQARLECCDLPIAVQTVLDPDNRLYAVRFANDHDQPLELCLMAATNTRTNDAAMAKRCWQAPGTRKQQVPAGARIEFFEGQFTTTAPVAGQPWEQLYLLVREVPGTGRAGAPMDPRNGFKVVRRRSSELWSLPRTFGLCGDVSSEIDITRSLGVAAQKLRSTEPTRDDIPDGAIGDDASLLHSDLYVGVIDLSLGGYGADGALDSFARRIGLDDSFLSALRIAGHWQGSRYLGKRNPRQLQWIVQVDSTKDDLDRLGSNLARSDPRRLFRQLETDRYYPTYGDDSTTVLATDSQGAFFARVQLDDSYAAWGNYVADFTDTELAHFNRTLYGASVAWQSEARTLSGESRYSLKAVGSEAETVSAHETFLATGGSLYYLGQQNIVLGSERVRIEVRRRGSQQLEERDLLVAGVDYEIDPLQGRIILSQPLAATVRERRNPVVFSGTLEGDQVFLAVDYEYVPTTFNADDLVYGVRAATWVNDALRLGGTYVNDDQGVGGNTLAGVDLRLQRSERSYLALEYADSDAQREQSPRLSLDGGLSFTAPNRARAVEAGRGDGYALEGSLDLADFSLGRGSLRGWYSERRAGYSSSRFAGSAAVRDQGADLTLPLGPAATLSAGFRALEQGDDFDERSGWLQLQSHFRCGNIEGCWSLEVEARYDSVASRPAGSTDELPLLRFLTRGPTGTGMAAGVRLSRQIGPGTTVYGALQEDWDNDEEYLANGRIALGINRQLSDQLALSVEASDGQRGDALTAGVDYTPGNATLFNLSTGVGAGATTQFSTRYRLSDNQALYGSYRVNPDRTDTDQRLLSIGQRRDLGRRSRVYSESQFGHIDRMATTGHLFGVDLGLRENLVLAATVAAHEVERQDGTFERSAFSLGTVYTRPSLRLSTRAELRRDDGPGIDAWHYLLSSAVDLRAGSSGRLTARLNAALLDDARSALDTGRFVEANVGYAYRPTRHDRFNALLRYGYLYDVASAGQNDALGDERSHLLSAEGFFETTPRLRLGAKIAGRYGSSRPGKGFGRWDDVHLSLASARMLLHLNPGRKRSPPPARDPQRPWLPNRLELLGEYRWLRDWSGESTRQGLLLGLYYHIDSRNWNSPLSNSLRLGVGYNFSGFSDDLRRDSFRANGWFIDFTSAF